MARRSLSFDAAKIQGGPQSNVRLTIALADRNTPAFINKVLVDSAQEKTGTTDSTGMLTLTDVVPTSDFDSNEQLNNGEYSYVIRFPTAADDIVGTFTMPDNDEELLDILDG